MLSLVCLTFISLLVVCSASWSIKHEQAKDYDPFVVNDEVYSKIKVDTSSFFESKTTFTDSPQKPTIVDDNAAQKLFGVSKATVDANPGDYYTIEWQAGTYFSDVNGSKNIKRADVENKDVRADKYAGVHYYRIVDKKTGTVICYKHSFTINKAIMSAPTPVSLTPGFTHETKSYSVAWTLVGGTKKTFGPANESITSLMGRNENKDADGKRITTFQNSQALAGKFTLDPVVLFATDEPFINNYDLTNASTTVSFVALSKAYVKVANGTPIYYGTLGEALASSGNAANTTVVALQGFECTYTLSNGNQTTSYYTAGSDTADAEYTSKKKIPYTHELNDNYTVNSNVTLLIPYDTGIAYYNFSNRTYTPELITTNGTSTASNYLATSAYKDPTHYLKNTVTIAAGHKLSINGKLVIPGVISGGAGGATLASVTGGNHSRINLNAGASIVNTASDANITCYGYIDEKGANTKVDVAKGNIDVVFSIVEHRGGAIFLAMAGGMSNALNLKIEDCAPFNRFYVESVTSQIQITEGANMRGYYDIYVGDQHFTDHVGFFGSGANCFLGFDPNDGKTSKAFLKYDPTKDQNILKVQGNAAINKIEMNIKVGGVFSVTLSTQWVYLPLSHYWDVTFQRFDGTGAEATINAQGQDIKVMPGATVTIENGVTFQSKNIAVYTVTSPNIPSTAGGFDYFAKAAEDASGYDADPETAGQQVFDATKAATYVDGKLIVSGSLEVWGALGGEVLANASTSRVNVGASSLVVKELVTSTGTGTDGEVTYTNPPLTLYANGVVADSDNSSKQNTTLDKSGLYVSVQRGSEYVWFAPQAILTLNPNGGTAGDASVRVPVDMTVGITNAQNLLNAVKPTRAGYTFEGWYHDAAGSVPVDFASIKYDTTLYAKWSLNATVTFVSNGGTEIAPKSVSVFGDGITQTEFLEKIDGSLSQRSGYKFLGWYIDEALQTKVTREWFATQGANITLYAGWEEVVTYRVDLNMGELDGRTGLFDITSVEAPEETVLRLPTASNIDSTITESRYFIGWSITKGGSKVDNITIDMLTPTGTDSEGKSTYTLYAVWGTKVTVTFDARDYSKLITLLGSKVVGGGVESIYLKPGASYDISKFGNYQYLDDANPLYDHELYFAGKWADVSGAVIKDNTVTVNTSTTDGSTVTVKPLWENKYIFKVKTDTATITITVKANVAGTDNTYTYTAKSETAGRDYYAIPGTTVTAAVTYQGSGWRVPKIAGVIGYDVKVDKNNYQDEGLGLSEVYELSCPINGDKLYQLYASATSNCLAAGTLVTLADGTTKKIEDVLPTDKLLVFDHETGRFTVGEIMLIETHEGWGYYQLINARFSNGTVVRIITEHGFFDLTLNKYVYIRADNYDQFIGHEFAVVNGDKIESVTLEEIFITTEYTGIYNIVTKYHLNCISDGLLSMSGAIEGTFNIFEYDEDLRYDQEKMAQDIEKYGLFTYEDFSEHVPKEVFDMFPAQYFKISIAKGYTTYEKLLALANEYLVKHGYYTPTS